VDAASAILSSEGVSVPAIVETHDLARSFGEIQAVKGVSFEIAEGEVFSLLGPNGAGKTTTISMLSCLITPTSGDATVAGHSIVRDSMAVRRTIGVVPQEIALYDALTARENLSFWGRMYGMGGATLRQRVGEVLDLVGLTDRADQKIRTYSGGMKRRVNIGAGLLHRPKLVFMDEPTVGVDPQSRRSILDSVKELSRAGMTVLYTTHNMEEAQELSDRVGIIDHGELIAIGTQEELTRLVGERESLRLHVGEDEDAGRLAEGLKGASGVLAASAADHEVVVTVARADESVAPVIVRASELGFRVRSVDIEEPNLEAVFLRLTGRALRD
jgi:ABC-2 type transport system ATP-binding protein